MESVTVSSELPYIQKRRRNITENPYNIDLWKEVKKHWLVFGVLGSITLAVISPRIGAPGGKHACSLLDHSRTHCTHPAMLLDHLVRNTKKNFNFAGPLRAEYLSWVPSSIIYFGAGTRLRRPRAPAKALRLSAAAALHAHIAAPAAAVCAVSVFSAALHAPVISGALLSSVGSGCGWLSLALAPHASLPLSASYTVSLLATPLSALLLCGRASIPPLSDLLSTTLQTLVPFTFGCAAAPLRQQAAADRLAALALVYTECCARLSEAEGALLVGDVLATLFVEVCWLALSAGACAGYARWWGAGGARLIALVAVPKALDRDWGAAAACRLPALAQLPAACAAPAQALLLAALHPHHHLDQEQLPF